MELFVDPTGGGMAGQIYAQLRDAITDGRLVTGDRLTPSRVLARDLGVSRFTVTDAYARLGAEGLIEGRAGAGSVVCATATRAAIPDAAGALAPTPRAAHIEMYAPDPTAEARFDLRPGRVDPTLFPTGTWRRCMMRALRDAPPAYGDPANDHITDNDLRATTRAHGLRVPPLATSYRFTTPHTGWIIGFGATPTPHIPTAIDALTTALDTATHPH